MPTSWMHKIHALPLCACFQNWIWYLFVCVCVSLWGFKMHETDLMFNLFLGKCHKNIDKPNDGTAVMCSITVPQDILAAVPPFILYLELFIHNHVYFVSIFFIFLLIFYFIFKNDKNEFYLLLCPLVKWAISPVMQWLFFYIVCFSSHGKADMSW